MSKFNELAVAAAVSAGLMAAGAAQAADVLLFPYVGHSASVSTIVSVVNLDTGAAGPIAGRYYDSLGNTGAFPAANRLHWRLNYKADANATSNAASCSEVDYYLPTSYADIQSVDLSAHFGATNYGVLFNDPSVNNNYLGALGGGTLTYALGSRAGAVARGVLFVHNADSVAGQTLQGEAMMYEFATGAAWGYTALAVDEGAGNTLAGFNFAGLGSTTGTAVTFMPTAETTTRLFVTPLNDAGAGSASMLDVNGATGVTATWWDSLTATVGMVTGTGVAYDRDENLVSGAVPASVTCVGAVNVTDLMTSGAATVLANGGWGMLDIAGGAAAVPDTSNALVIKLEFQSAGGTFAGVANSGTFNNGFFLP